MNFAYLSCDGFFNLVDDIPCLETKLLVETMIKALRDTEEVAADDAADNKHISEGMRAAAQIFQEALENYMINRSRHEDMILRPPTNPDRN